MFCLKCKKNTETENIKIEGKFKKGNCVICGTKKSKFIKIKGKGLEERNKYARYAKLAYESPKNRATNEDTKLSTSETAVFLEGDEVIIAYRGTTPSTKDLLADARILVGNFLNGPRFKRSLQTTQKAISKYPNKRVTLTGHSLGARIAHDIGTMLNLKSYSYNIGSSPVDIPNNIIESLRCKFTTDEEHKEACEKIKENNKSYHTYGDPLSLSSVTGHHDTEFIKPKQTNIHGIDNFIDSETN